MAPKVTISTSVQQYEYNALLLCVCPFTYTVRTGMQNSSTLIIKERSRDHQVFLRIVQWGYPKGQNTLVKTYPITERGGSPTGGKL